MNPNLPGLMSRPGVSSMMNPAVSGGQFTSQRLPVPNMPDSVPSQLSNLSAPMQLDPMMPSSMNAQAVQMSNGQALGQTPASAQSQIPKEFNAAVLCKLGQENVHEIVGKASELFQYLKVKTPIGPQSQQAAMQEEKKAKVRDTLKIIEQYFKRLRKVYEKCGEYSTMDYVQVETLIPMKDDVDCKQDDKKVNTLAVKMADKERQELTELLQLKNRQIKEVIDNLRSIVWEINTMLAMRKP